jgi:hypothetical protein
MHCSATRGRCGYSSCETAHSNDLAWLRRRGMPKPGGYSLEWSHVGRARWLDRIVAEADRVRLFYRITGSNGRRISVRKRSWPLRYTATRLGGSRQACFAAANTAGTGHCVRPGQRGHPRVGVAFPRRGNPFDAQSRRIECVRHKNSDERPNASCGGRRAARSARTAMIPTSCSSRSVCISSTVQLPTNRFGLREGDRSPPRFTQRTVTACSRNRELIRVVFATLPF